MSDDRSEQGVMLGEVLQKVDSLGPEADKIKAMIKEVEVEDKKE